MKRLIGRPKVGPRVILTMEQELVDRLDAHAAALGVQRASLVRTLLKDGLDLMDRGPDVRVRRPRAPKPPARITPASYR